MGVTRNDSPAGTKSIATPASTIGEFAAIAKGSLVPARYARLCFSTGEASNPTIAMLPQSLQLQQAMQDYQIVKGNDESKTEV